MVVVFVSPRPAMAAAANRIIIRRLKYRFVRVYNNNNMMSLTIGTG